MTLRPSFRYSGALLLKSNPVVRERRKVYSAQQRNSAACLQVMFWGKFMLPPVCEDAGAVWIFGEDGVTTIQASFSLVLSYCWGFAQDLVVFSEGVVWHDK